MSHPRAQNFTDIVLAWSKERESLGCVQPYTAKKSAQKALLLAPWIGATRIDRIEPRSITEGLVSLGTNGGRKGDGLSSGTLRAVHLAGTQAVDWAIANNLAKANPFKQVARPRASYRTSKYLTMGQASRLASEMHSLTHRMVVCGNVIRASFALAACIALATGMRRGEIFALDWAAIDTVHGRINVSKAVKADSTVGVPKSTSGIRSVAIGKYLSDLLIDIKAWQAMVLPEKPWDSPQFVIADSQGNRASMNSFEHWWRTWAEENSLGGLRFHELRHTHATLLISSGVDVKTVQMRLGHASAEITMSCYAHALPLSDGNAANSLDSALFS